MKANLSLLIISTFFLINFSIRAQEVSYIIIRDAPDGRGQVVRKWLRSDDEQIRLYCAGYDESLNIVGNIPVFWRIILDDGNLVVNADLSDSLVFQNNGPPLQISNILAYHNDLNLQDSTGVLYLIDKSLHYIQIRTAPDGSRTCVTRRWAAGS